MYLTLDTGGSGGSGTKFPTCFPIVIVIIYMRNSTIALLFSPKQRPTRETGSMAAPQALMAVETILIMNRLLLFIFNWSPYAMSGFQKCLENRIMNVYSSSLPAIIVRDSTRVLKSE